ncbi:class III lanthipeptide [Bifidobacterium catenulatum]
MNEILQMQALYVEETERAAGASSVSIAFSCKKFSSISLLIC